MTNAEKAELDDVVELFNQTEARIKAANVGERLEDMSRPMPRRSIPDDLPFAEASNRRPARTITGGAPAGTRQSSTRARRRCSAGRSS